MKIYNEISIDMNPESSSYGEALHEDSFDYEGPMMQMAHESNVPQIESSVNPGYDIQGHPMEWNIQGQEEESEDNLDEISWEPPPGPVTDKIQDYSGYEGHEPYSYDGQDYYIMDHLYGVKLLLDLDGNIIYRTDSKNDKADSEIETFLEEDYKQDEQVELAPQIKYQDYEQYLDEETGKVSDPWGFAKYLQQLPPYTGKSHADIYDLIKDAPSGLFVSEQDVSEAKKGYEGKRQSIYEGLMSKRQAAESQLATGGAYNPQQMELGNIIQE